MNQLFIVPISLPGDPSCILYEFSSILFLYYPENNASLILSPF